jgi:hypothetical protein
MKTPRALVPVLLAAGLALAACGGSSSGGTPSAAGSKASAIASALASASLGASTAPSVSTDSSASGGGGGAVAASDKAFCDTFSSAKDRFGAQAGLPTGDDLKKIKQFADDLEKTAPAEIKDDAKVLADYFRFIANLASKGVVPSAGADLEKEITKVQPAIIHVTTWSATHCSHA